MQVQREKNSARLPALNRLALTGIWFVLETRLRWRDLPAETGYLRQFARAASPASMASVVTTR